MALRFLPDSLERDELARKRFLREAESAATLDHPFICHINEVARTDDGQDFIVMEYVEGRALKEKLAEGPLPLKQALQVGVEIAEALEVAHQKGIVHRDLKPANIILTQQGHAKIMDFGLAKKVITEEGKEEDLTSALPREGSTLGTPAYMSPEQVRAQPVDHRSDIFSFGILLYEMLTGVHPFRKNTQSETTAAILDRDPPPLGAYLDDAPELLQHTVRKMLAKSPEQRYQAVHEIRTNLEEVRENSGPQVLGGGNEAPVPRRLSWLVLSAAAVLLLAGATAVFLGWIASTGRGPDKSSSLQPFPFTTCPGSELRPDFSPQGDRVVFDWAQEDTSQGIYIQDIYVKQVGGGDSRIQLTTDPAYDRYARWSPDGQQIAFARWYPD